MAPCVYNGIDRVKPDAGYIPSNCVPCCGVCNFMKRNHTYREFLFHCAKIIKHREALEKVCLDFLPIEVREEAFLQ
jgi:hypothetical protein